VTIHDYHVTMKTVGIAELKARLSEYLRGVRRGQELTVVDRATPVARIVPYTEDAPALVVRRARPNSRLHAIRLPRPLPLETDVLTLLRAERQRDR
jgi:prevent-host-death family protein